MSDAQDFKEIEESPEEETAEQEAPSEEKKEGDLSEMLIDDIMIAEVECLTPNMKVKDCIQTLLEKGISGCPLVKEGSKKIVGVIGQKDLIHFAAVGGLDKQVLFFIDKITKVDQLIATSRDETVKEVVIKFLKNPVRRLIVLDDTGNVEGIVTRSSLLKVFLQGS